MKWRSGEKFAYDVTEQLQKTRVQQGFDEIIEYMNGEIVLIAIITFIMLKMGLIDEKIIIS